MTVEQEKKNTAENTVSNGPSARGIGVSFLIWITAAAGLWGAVNVCLSSHKGVQPRASKSSAISQAVSDGVSRCPRDSVVLVLLNSQDMMKLAYDSYHAPDKRNGPEKISASTSTDQKAAEYDGRTVLFSLCDTSKPVQVDKIIASYNAGRYDSNIDFVVAISWRNETEAFAALFDAEGRAVK
jgi:hypothetical protein